MQLCNREAKYATTFSVATHFQGVTKILRFCVSGMGTSPACLFLIAFYTHFGYHIPLYSFLTAEICQQKLLL
jgi:purine-cytosine permease-like protein